MAKKTHVKVRMVPEAKPDSPFFYYVKKPAGGEKAKVKFLLKEQGMTINGVKKILNNEVSLKLDEIADKSIRTENLRNKLLKISNKLKELKNGKKNTR